MRNLTNHRSNSLHHHLQRLRRFEVISIPAYLASYKTSENSEHKHETSSHGRSPLEKNLPITHKSTPSFHTPGSMMKTFCSGTFSHLLSKIVKRSPKYAATVMSSGTGTTECAVQSPRPRIPKATRKDYENCSRLHSIHLEFTHTGCSTIFCNAGHSSVSP
jgi:hypothetical protein